MLNLWQCSFLLGSCWPFGQTLVAKLKSVAAKDDVIVLRCQFLSVIGVSLYLENVNTFYCAFFMCPFCKKK